MVRCRLLCVALITLCLAPGILFAQTPRATGLIFAHPAAYQSIPLATPPPAGELPASVDFSSLFPIPGNQGQQGSCVGWAVGYALKSYQERQERKWPLDNAERLFSPAYVYNQIKQGDCQGGSQITDALDLLTREGVAPLSRFSYDANDCYRLPDAAAKQAAQEFAIASWRRVNVQDVTEVKSQIAAGFPVVIGMVIDEPFQNLIGDLVYRGPQGASRGGHALVVTGYDDARSAFRVINSWGTSWGDGGFGWIAYDTFRQTVREAYVVQDIVRNTPPQPQPRPTPPRPQPQQPVASVDPPVIDHNNWRNGFWWMDVVVPGWLQGYRGRRAIVVVRLAFQDGTDLYAHPQEGQYVDATRHVTTGQHFTVSADYYDLSQLTITIPYYAFNLTDTGRNTTYYLMLWADVYIDDVQVAQSAQTVPFTVRW